MLMGGFHHFLTQQRHVSTHTEPRNSFFPFDAKDACPWSHRLFVNTIDAQEVIRSGKLDKLFSMVRC
jgi:hypothetical protein